jgi:hypothetical protein
LAKPKACYALRVGQPAGLKWPAGLCYNKRTLSTWAEFAEVTGIDLPGSCIAAKPVRRKRTAAAGGAG